MGGGGWAENKVVINLTPNVLMGAKRVVKVITVVKKGYCWALNFPQEGLKLYT